MNPARRTLDPRAKLYLLLVANLMLFFHVGSPRKSSWSCCSCYPCWRPPDGEPR